ncbi:amidohydrolase, partial [Salmonella enterica subsp. enterica serovar Istanbul]|nr:amidohydrolase [Salmonella enterica subsp. enterica serovar Istanbul]
GLPLSFHGSYHWNDQLISTTNRFITAHALGFTFFNALHCANWVTNGLPERFPKLKVIWIESGLAWVPWLMQRLDNDYRMRTSECPSLKRLPSDYMREMYYTTQPMEMVNNHKALELTFE